MTLAQSKKIVLGILRKAPMLRGFKLSEFGPNTMIYFPYIPLYTTPDLPLTPEAVENARRQLAAERQRVEEHLAASRNVNLTVQ